MLIYRMVNMKDTLPPELGYLHLLAIDSLVSVVTGTGTMAVVCACAAW